MASSRDYIATFKRHPISITLFAFYIVCWPWLGYIAYCDYTGHGDGETFGMSLFGISLGFFLPYLIIIFLKAAFAKQYNDFYWSLLWLILMPLPVAALIGLAVHFLC